MFGGKEIGYNRDYSENTANVIDAEVKAIIDKAYKRAEDILKENREILNKIVGVLLEKEIISGDEIDEILSEAGIDPPKKGNE